MTPHGAIREDPVGVKAPDCKLKHSQYRNQLHWKHLRARRLAPHVEALTELVICSSNLVGAVPDLRIAVRCPAAGRGDRSGSGDVLRARTEGDGNLSRQRANLLLGSLKHSSVTKLWFGLRNLRPVSLLT